MINFRALAMKSAALAALVIGTSAAGIAPVTSTPPIDSSSWKFPIYGSPYVGSELALGKKVSGLCSNPATWPAPQYLTEWLSDGVPLPEERQGEVLKLTPEDRGHSISMNIHVTCKEPKVFQSVPTPPIAASNRAMGWTNRGTLELLGRTPNGDLVLYPSTVESYWRFYDPSTDALAYTSSWDEPKVVGTGWNMFDIVFSPGDFDGDGYNDVLGRDSAGRLFLYPGDGDGGWLPPKQVGTGWQIFNSIIGAGDFDGDGYNDVLGRDSAGRLFLYPGDGDGGWLPPKQVGTGWQVFDKIIATGDTGADGAVDIFARDNAGVLHQYPADGKGGWKSPVVVGPGWDVMNDILGPGRFTPANIKDSTASLVAVDQEGDLHGYSGAPPTGLDGGSVIGPGWNIFKNLI